MTLHELVDVECARFRVPGAAVTAVAGGEVLLSQGFGSRDGRAPVTSSTLFMLASDTKCFAAATLCLLVEDGLLDLDEPVRTYLPWFAMHDDRVSGWVTCRDLLAHRTGLPAHALMTVGNGDFTVSNEDIARRMRHLEATRPFRQGFGYNNVHYATAGHVAEVLTGQPWKDLLSDRVLNPLRMTATSTYHPDLTAEDFASPHASGARMPFQTRPYDLPSGGIVTNADDLGRWLLARLGQGGLSRAVLDLLHTPSVVAEGLPFPEVHPMGYALGNLLVSYRGHRLHLHGGSQLGFASQVMVLPDAQVGVAVLTNEHGSRLPLALGLGLVDRLLGLEPLPWGSRLAGPPPAAPALAAPDGAAPHDLHEYAGVFHHPAYGELGLEVRHGALRARFHGLDDDLVLTHRGQDDWQLTFRQVPGFSFPLSFTAGPGGRLADVAVRVEPELPPVLFRRR